MFLLGLAWSDGCTADGTVELGIFSTKESLEVAKKDVLDNADRNMWPWHFLNNKNTSFYVQELIVDLISIPLSRSHYLP